MDGASSQLAPTYQLVRYFRVRLQNSVAPAALEMTTYQLLEYFLTLDDEVQFMAALRWNVVHALFIVTRYLPFVFMSLVIYGLLFIIMLATEGIKASRDSDDITLTTQFRAAPNPHSCVVAREQNGPDHLGNHLCVVASASESQHLVAPTSSFCLSPGVNDYAVAGFAGTVFFEFVVLSLTVYFEISTRTAGLAVAKVVSTANIIVFMLPAEFGVSEQFDVLQGVLHSVMASRILFKLRRVYGQDQTEQPISLADLRFVSIHVDSLAGDHPPEDEINHDRSSR
ncbi:hypothetical protein BJ138DRAFT_1097076 [Hygrophoropsis aurantiaca]|uniref:Uncharacterized protein n=1 Tax=Hygrophoropsis aurantiaca TaxID=72124 RepID=A0ACB8AU80_9AGAM|nr:hypothetical protein BJ138DRAFT_1097076 [Hygrophoropsis aurantiaca]